MATYKDECNGYWHADENGWNPIESLTSIVKDFNCLNVWFLEDFVLPL